MKWYFNRILEIYGDDKEEIQKKAKILAIVSFVLLAFSALLSAVMFATGAVVVAILVCVFFLINALTLTLIYYKHFRIAANIFLTVLFFILFFAIKFDQYVTIYESYVFGTLGLFLILTVALVGYAQFQPILFTVCNVVAIVLLYVLDAYPQNGNKVTMLDIQSLATAFVMVVLGGVFAVRILSLQKTLIKHVEEERQKTEERFEKLDALFTQGQIEAMSIGKQISSSSDRTQHSVTDVSGYLTQIGTEFRVLNESITGSAQANEDVVEASGIIKEKIEIYNNTVDRMTAAIEEIATSIQELSKNVGDRKGLIDRLVEKTKAGETKMLTAEESIEKVSKAASGILEMINIIVDVSQRTNILALNAAIEASHAGEKGKGFAVVASEIRNLAQASGSSSQQIILNLRKSIEDIHKSSSINKEAGQVFFAISAEIRTIAELLEEIIYSIREIGNGSNEILKAVTEISHASQTTESAVGTAGTMIEKSNQAIKIIEQQSSRILSDISSITSTFAQIENEAQEVNSLGAKNVDFLGELYQRIQGTKHSD